MSDTADSRQYLTFVLDSEIYALEIFKVREVLDFAPITKIPRMPEFLRGVINLRGGVITVVDLKRKFGMPGSERTRDTCIIIAEVTVDNETTIMGLLVDSVREVIDLEAAAIQPPPRMGTRLDTRFIKGMGRQDGEFIIILDIDLILSADEIAMAAAAAGHSAAAAEAPAAGS
ncbi:MAG: chemotaxis protein CheW [Thermodesulfobacteriota bacterium]